MWDGNWGSHGMELANNIQQSDIRVKTGSNGSTPNLAFC